MRLVATEHSFVRSARVVLTCGDGNQCGCPVRFPRVLPDAGTDSRRQAFLGMTKSRGVRYLSTLVPFAMILVLPIHACLGQQALRIGTEKQVFIDNRFVQDAQGVGLVVNKPRLDREQLIVSEHPWEDQMIGGYTSVIQEGSRVHLWYEARDQQGTWSLAYAYSDDKGRTFTKPSLGVIEYEGSTDNNLVLTGGLGHHVFRMGPDAPPSEKYGCLRHVDGNWPNYTPGTNRGFVSPDGIHWTPKGDVPFLYEEGIQTTDSQNVTFWDTRLEKYVVYPRLFSSAMGRAVGRAEADEFGDFPREESPVVLQRDAEDAGKQFYTSAM